jgi:uncharacterized repeat protein (TIGR01451 family)
MRSRSFAALALAVVVGGLVGASRAHANHVFGATYVGTHSGGGQIRFTVSRDGTDVTSLAFTNLPAGCGLSIGSSDPRQLLAPITNHAFSHTSAGTPADPVSFGGSFSGPLSASGTLRWTLGHSCDEASPTVTWTATTTAPPVADLSVEVTDSPDPVAVGGRVTYTVEVSNIAAPALGSSPATGVNLAVSLPAGATFVSASVSQGSCNHVPGSAVTCALGTIASGGKAEATVVATARRAGQLTLTAAVTTEASDPVPDNNIAQVQTTARAACVVPRVVGKPLTAAKRAIARAHCSTGRITRAASAKVATGRVIAQRPAPGSRRPSLAKVDLVVSRGPSRMR